MAPAETSEHNQRQAMLLGIAAVILWSTVATAFECSLQEITPTAPCAWASLEELDAHIAELES